MFIIVGTAQLSLIYLIH